MNRIAELRRARGLTQEEAARRAKVGVRTWQAWEAGKHTPWGRHRRKAALVLDASEEELGLEEQRE